MSRKLQILSNWVCLILVLVVNLLANILPINGITTAAVSAKYTNLFVPAGFTFIIWLPIYVFLIFHTVFSNNILKDKKTANSNIGILVKKINPWFRLGCVLNAGWIFAWHYELIDLSALLTGGLLISLIAIFYQITWSEKYLSLTYKEHVCLETPFVFYLSWVNVAFIANVAAMKISQGWKQTGMAPWMITCLLIGLAALIALWISLKFRRPAFAAVAAWAFIGLYVKQASADKFVGYAALISFGLCLLAGGIGFWQKRKMFF